MHTWVHLGRSMHTWKRGKGVCIPGATSMHTSGHGSRRMHTLGHGGKSMHIWGHGGSSMHTWVEAGVCIPKGQEYAYLGEAECIPGAVGAAVCIHGGQQNAYLGQWG